MKKFFAALVVTASVVLPFTESVANDSARATEGVMLISSEGACLGPVYRVADDGSALLIVKGKMATVPASSLSIVDGKLMTSLTKTDVRNLN